MEVICCALRRRSGAKGSPGTDLDAAAAHAMRAARQAGAVRHSPRAGSGGALRTPSGGEGSGRASGVAGTRRGRSGGRETEWSVDACDDDDAGEADGETQALAMQARASVPELNREFSREWRKEKRLWCVVPHTQRIPLNPFQDRCITRYAGGLSWSRRCYSSPLRTCSDDSKPYYSRIHVVLKGLDDQRATRTVQDHVACKAVGFAIIQASGEEWQPPTSSHVRATVWSSERERVKR